jgi:Mrp family chromosome partitioning ATPase
MKKTSKPRVRRRRVDQAKVPEDALILVDGYGAAVQLIPPAVVESMRAMIARVRVGDGSDLPKRIGVTSSIPGEGVTFIARTLALLLTHDTRKSVCLVDLNWWSPPGSGGDYGVAGLAEVINDGVELSSVLVETGNPGLTLLSAGVAALSDRPLLSNSVELDRILADLEEQFDHLVLDLPAVSASADSLTLAHKANAVLFVIHHGVTPEADAKDAVDQLQGVPILGALLNRSTSKVPAFIRRRVAGI